MVGRGRQKTELNFIEKKESRLVCFSKRRSGLFKKARELSILMGAKIRVIIFSPAGKLHTFNASTVDSLLGCQMEKHSNSAIESEFVDGIDRNEAHFWWNIPQVEAMGYEELIQFDRAMLEYTEEKFGTLEKSAEHLQAMEQHGPAERSLIDHHHQGSNAPISASLQTETEMEMEMEMDPLEFDPTMLSDDQWLQWLDDRTMEDYNLSYSCFYSKLF